MKQILIALLFVLIPLSSQADIPGFLKARMGTLEGDFIVDGKPMPKIVVSFFAKNRGPAPTDGNSRRIPESITRADDTGHFIVKLLPGDYYIGALIRAKDKGPGPPRPGETYYFAVDETGNLKLFTVPMKATVNVGQVVGGHPAEGQNSQNVMTVKGQIVDELGNPFSGAAVLAKTDLKFARPSFVSKPTDENGFFILQLPPDISYYLLAREVVKGLRPRPGDYVGTYGKNVFSSGFSSGGTGGSPGGGSPPPGVLDNTEVDPGEATTVTGKAGETVSNVIIKMFKVPDPQEVKSEIQGSPDSPKLETEGIAIEHIFFQSNRATLTTESFAELDKWASFLIGKPEVKVEITGHTDSVGSAGYNLTLSKSRAQAVADYLIQMRVAPEKLNVTGMGEDMPVAGNDTPEGRQQNRRVELKFTGLREAQPAQPVEPEQPE